LVVTCWLGAGGSCAPLPNNTIQEEGSGEAEAPSAPNPFDFFFNRSSNANPQLVHSKSTSAIHQLVPLSRETTTHAHFIRALFAKSHADVAVYIDNTSHLDTTSLARNACPNGIGGHNTVFLPFFGGPDDRAALDMVVQICRDTSVRGVIVRVTKGERGTENAGDELGRPPAAFIPGTVASAFEGTIGGTVAGNTISQFPDTIYAPHTDATRLQSQTADEMAWDKYTSETSPHSASSNVEFTHVRSPAPLKALTTVARTVQTQSDQTGRMLLIVGRSRRLAVESHHAELAAMVKESTNNGDHLSSEFRKTIGDVASALVVGGIGADMIVLQAGRASATAGVEV